MVRRESADGAEREKSSHDPRLANRALIGTGVFVAAALVPAPDEIRVALSTVTGGRRRRAGALPGLLSSTRLERFPRSSSPRSFPALVFDGLYGSRDPVWPAVVGCTAYLLRDRARGISSFAWGWSPRFRFSSADGRPSLRPLSCAARRRLPGRA